MLQMWSLRFYLKGFSTFFHTKQKLSQSGMYTLRNVVILWMSFLAGAHTSYTKGCVTQKVLRCHFATKANFLLIPSTLCWTDQGLSNEPSCVWQSWKFKIFTFGSIFRTGLHARSGLTDFLEISQKFSNHPYFLGQGQVLCWITS